jgi:hypothetical protein
VRPAALAFVLLFACDGGDRPEPPRPPERPPEEIELPVPVTGPASDPDLDERYDGPRVQLRLREGSSDVVPVVGRSWTFVAVRDGAEHVLWAHPPLYDVACSECGRPLQPAPSPSHHPFHLTDRSVLMVLGPRPGASATAACSDGSACTMRRALPAGEYRLIARGDTFECDEVAFTVPLAQRVEGECRRIDEP